MINIKATNTILYTLALVSLFGFFSGCVSPILIDYEQGATDKFLEYNSSVIDSREERSAYQHVALSPIVDRRITRAINSVLLNKGYRNDATDIDFRVTFSTSKKERINLLDLNAGPPPFRRNPYFGIGTYSNMRIDTYDEGTIVIDIIDARSQQLVWRAAHTERLARKARTDSEIHTIITQIRGNFPPDLQAHSN
ncbi:MAG: DUF4136 domain-containing protein [Verrucomicrobiota bacterium]|nr:DUF4136 domain-containing protein [Verrucomicrobiota bacterium]